MILRLLGLGILFLALLCCLPFLVLSTWPFGWSFGDLGLLSPLLCTGFGIYLLAYNRRAGQLTFGILLLFSGFAFLSHNFWDFDFFRFWPLLLIFWGLVLIVQRLALNDRVGRPSP